MSATPYLILVKHAFPAIVPGLPANQWHLSSAGRERCKALAQKLAVYQPEVILSSIEPKAIETAQIVAEQLGLPFKTVPGLHEHERNNVKFGSRHQFETAVACLFEQPFDLIFGEETAEQAYQRFAGSVMSLLEQYNGKSLAIVAHGTVITLFAARVCGIEPFPFWKRLGLPSFLVLSLPGMEVKATVEEV